MTAANFDFSLVLILKEEGGNDDDPYDHGGRTSRGIIQREWDVWRKTHPDLPEDVWQAPQDQIDAIYREQYWNPYCDTLPPGVDLVFFNASVNSGRQQAVKELQRALGVTADGMMGMVTMQAAQSTTDLQALIHRCCEQRRAFYKALAQFPRYGRGWMARTDRVEAAARSLAPATGTVTTVVTASPKADPSQTVQPTVSVQTASGGAAAATVASGVSDQLQNLSTALSPMAETIKWVKIACMVIAVVCAGLAIYAVIHKSKTEAVT